MFLKRLEGLAVLRDAMPNSQSRRISRFLRTVFVSAAALALVISAPAAENPAQAKASVGESPADAAITVQIQKSLRSDLPSESRDVIVRTRDAHAHLYGIVDSQVDKKRASRLAAKATGVVHVANHLTVSRPWKQKSDADIKKDLEKKLVWTFATGAELIDVTVEEGVAIFTGRVHTWMEWQKAMELAFEAGARRPHNLLDVHRDGDRPDPDTYVPR